MAQAFIVRRGGAAAASSDWNIFKQIAQPGAVNGLWIKDNDAGKVHIKTPTAVDGMMEYMTISNFTGAEFRSTSVYDIKRDVFYYATSYTPSSSRYARGFEIFRYDQNTNTQTSIHQSGALYSGSSADGNAYFAVRATLMPDEDTVMVIFNAGPGGSWSTFNRTYTYSIPGNTSSLWGYTGPSTTSNASIMSAEIYDGFVYSLCPTSSTSQQRVYICDIPSKTNTIVMYNGWAAVRYNQTNITVYDGVVYFFGRASSSGTAWSCWKYDIATQTQSCTLINGAAWSTVPVLISGALGIYVRVMGNIYLYDPRNETLTLLGTTTLAVADGAMGMYDPYNFYVMTTGAGGKFIVRTENFPIGDIVVGAKPGSAGTGVLLYDDENTALTCDVAYVVKQTSNGLAAVGAAVNINGGGWTDL